MQSRAVAKLSTIHIGCFVLAAVGAICSAAEEPQYPLAIAVDSSGSIYLADRNLPGVWIYKDGKAETFFVGSKKFRTPLNAVRCLALDGDGKLLAGDSATREVYRFDEDAKPVPLTEGGIGIPMSIAVRKDGSLLVADLELHRIWKVAKEGGKPEQFAQIQAPRALHVDREDRLWVVTHGENQLVQLDDEGKPQVIVRGRPFSFPSAVVVNESGTALVCDTYGKAIWKVESADVEPTKWVSGSPLVSPVGLAWQDADLLVADPRAGGIIRIDSAGAAKLLPYSGK